MFPTVPCQVTLAIAIEIEAARHHSTRQGTLPDSSAYHLALPLNIAGQTDIH
jgi:hypothetical protein